MSCISPVRITFTNFMDYYIFGKRNPNMRCKWQFKLLKIQRLKITESPDFSVLRQKWTQTMETKQNQTFFHRTNSNLSSCFFWIKNIELFQWHSKPKFRSFLWLKWTQTMKMKQNQKFFNGTYSSLTLFFIGRKILKHFNDSYN